MLEAGISPPDVIHADGKLHRFSTNGKAGDDAGYYRLHLDGIPAGYFGDWRGVDCQKWHSRIDRKLTVEERRAHRVRMTQARAEANAAKERAHAEACSTAAKIWAGAQPAPADHAYLTRKGVAPKGLRLHEGRLVVPMRDAAGTLHSLQFIDDAGEKRYLPGGEIRGHYFSIGKPDGELCIVEGLATGLSVHGATGKAVAVAFNAGNLEPVALELRAKFPDLKLVFAADDDAETEGNPGLAKARQAAQVVRGYLARPDFGPSRRPGMTDFNDLHQSNGVEAVRRSLENAVSIGNGKTPEPGDGSPQFEASERWPTICVRLSDVQPEPIKWLWPGRIARGKLTIIAGDPGLGKSQVAASMAAIVTTGWLWPVDRTRAERGNVIILSAEDDAADTIRPRLDAAGADASRIHMLIAVPEETDAGVIPRGFNLKTDLRHLEAAIARIGGAAMVVVDPISAYLGGVDSHKNADVRALLGPLSEMAARLGVAVIGISHLNKSGPGGALARVTGSLAFVAAARATYTVSKDPDDPARRLFLPAKNNIGPDQTGLAFKVEGHEYDAERGRIKTSRVMWDAEPVSLTADEALSQGDPEERSERDEAKDFLRDELAVGPKPTKDLKKATAAAGHSWRTVQRAKAELRIEATKTTRDGGWEWSLPKDAKGASLPRPQNAALLAPFDNGAGPSGDFGGKDAKDANPGDVDTLPSEVTI